MIYLDEHIQLTLDTLNHLRQTNPEAAKEQAKINLIRSGIAEIVDGEFRIKQLIGE
jgi:hypothetical protein